jgi:hypothetical protein
MRSKRLLALCATLMFSTAAETQKKPVGPPITPAQHKATLQGVLKGKEAAAQNATQAAAAYNNAYNAAAVANSAVKDAAGKVVPGGSTVYGAGNSLGTYIMTHPVTVQAGAPTAPKSGYTPSLPSPPSQYALPPPPPLPLSHYASPPPPPLPPPHYAPPPPRH